MADDKKNNRSLARPAATDAAVAAVLAVLTNTGDLKHAAVAAASAAGLKKLLTGSLDAVSFSSIENLAKYYGAVVAGMLGKRPAPVDQNTELDDAVEGLAEQLRTPASAAIVRDHIRRLQEAIEPEVIPTLGKLAAYYIERDRDGDSIFRALSRILADLSAEEHSELRILFSKAVPLVENLTPGFVLDLEYHPTKMRVYLSALDPDAEPARPSRELHVSGFESFDRLHFLIESNGLTVDNGHSRKLLDNDFQYTAIGVLGSASLILTRVIAEPNGSPDM